MRMTTFDFKKMSKTVTNSVFKAAPRSKYNAKKTVYKGIVYDSKKESEYAMYLDSQKRKKEIKKWTGQVPLPLIVNEQLIAKYICDFKVHNLDGTIDYIDVKGMKKGAAYSMFRLKKKLVKAVYDIEIIEV